MGLLSELSGVERQQFFSGQLLDATDLESLEAANRELRWLHNRSLHQPGIGSGFAVSGQPEDREVTIGPGYAIDALGREIVLTESKTEPVPPAAGGKGGTSALFYLTISYPEDKYLEEVETRTGVCSPPGVVRRLEEPVFCWVPLEKGQDDPLAASDNDPLEMIRTGLRIILAMIEVQNCQLKSKVSMAERQSARPTEQPHIAAGQTDSAEGGGTQWRFWPDPDDPARAWGIETDVDTGGGRFWLSPHYAGHVHGTRLLADALGLGHLEAEFAYTEMKAKTATTLIDGSPEAEACAERFSERFEALGGEILSSVTAHMDPTMVKAILEQLVDEGLAAVLYVPHRALAHMVVQAAESVDGMDKAGLITTGSVVPMVDGFVNVVNASPSGFTLRVLLPRDRVFGRVGNGAGVGASVVWLNPKSVFTQDGLELLKNELNWHAVWMGVEG